MSEEIKDIEQHSDMASEPTGAAAMIDYSETALMESDFHDFPLGKCGFYTDDPVEFEQRVAMIEADLDEVDSGIDDPQKWIQVDDFMAAMRSIRGLYHKVDIRDTRMNPETLKKRIK